MQHLRCKPKGTREVKGPGFGLCRKAETAMVRKSDLATVLLSLDGDFKPASMHWVSPGVKPLNKQPLEHKFPACDRAFALNEAAQKSKIRVTSQNRIRFLTLNRQKRW